MSYITNRDYDMWFNNDSKYKIYYNQNFRLSKLDNTRYNLHEGSRVIDNFFKSKAFPSPGCKDYQKNQDNLANSLSVINLEKYFQSENHYWTMMWLTQSFIDGTVYFPIAFIIASENTNTWKDDKVFRSNKRSGYFGRVSGIRGYRTWYSSLNGNTRLLALDFIRKLNHPSFLWTYNLHEEHNFILHGCKLINTKNEYEKIFVDNYSTVSDKLKMIMEMSFKFQTDQNHSLVKLNASSVICNENGFGYYSNQYLTFQAFIIDLLKNTNPLVIYITEPAVIGGSKGVYENRKKKIYEGFKKIPMEIETQPDDSDEKSIFGRQKKGVYFVMTEEAFLTSTNYYNYLLLLNDKKGYWVNKDETIYMVNAEFTKGYEEKYKGILP